MGINIKTGEFDANSELARTAFSMTGEDIRKILSVFLSLQARVSGVDPNEIANDMSHEATKAFNEVVFNLFGEMPKSTGLATIFTCALCLNLMVTVYTNAKSLAFSFDINGCSDHELNRILAPKTTPPRDDDGVGGNL